VAPHTLTNSEKIQNLTLKPKIMGTLFWERKGPILVNFFFLEETSSMLLFSKLKESLAGKTFGR
jgi:hypothetical protein